MVNWENNGFEIKQFPNANIRAESLYFRRGGTWSDITSGALSIRYFGEGYLFSTVGLALFETNSANGILWIVALLNSCVANSFLRCLNPTFHSNVGDVAKIPVIFTSEEIIEPLASECVDISNNDWDAFETSWDFKRHPMV